MPATRTIRSAAAALTALAAAAAVAGCSGASSGSNDTGNVGYVSTQIGISDIPAGQRVAAPALSGTTLTGSRFALTQDKGHITVINVWGSWCTPCRVEGPGLETAYQKYQAQGVDFLGIDARDDNDAALAYVNNNGITYPSLQDADETLLLQFKSVLPPTTIPSTVILDRSGKVAVRILGGTTAPQLEQQISMLLSQG
jgi:thiol-disulfide isomerase/thioredoxin